MRYMRDRRAALALVALVLGLVSGCAATKGETAGQYFDDAGITAAVKSKLAADTTSTLTRVSVETVRGTVYLTGIVDSQQAKQQATEISWQVKGVHTVKNEIQVQGAAKGAGG